VEIEVFVHGAMCLAYSGRCFLSAYTAGRSANLGECSHSCRWEYRYLEERQRPGEYFPVIEGDGFTTILSSKDLCMIDHLGDLKDAGVDSLKIEGRMKSLYYTATVTRAYRMALKALEGGAVPDLDAYKAELSLVSHREFCTGFFYGKEAVEPPTTRSYERERLFLGTVGEEVSPGVYRAEVKNHIDTREPIEFIGPRCCTSGRRLHHPRRGWKARSAGGPRKDLHDPAIGPGRTRLHHEEMRKEPTGTKKPPYSGRIRTAPVSAEEVKIA
jgi:putative protease